MFENPSDPEEAPAPQTAPSPQVDAARRALAEAEAEYEELKSRMVYCKHCATDVLAEGKGQCPVCKCFLPANLAALVHGGRRMDIPPPFKSRRAELKQRVWADLGDTLPPITAEVAEDFVSACVLRDQLVEHLEAIGPLTQRGTRRAAMDLYLATSARIERLSAMLGTFRSEARGDRLSTPSTTQGLDAMPVSALKDAQKFDERLLRGEVLSERELGALAYLKRAIRGEVVLPPDPLPDSYTVPEPGDAGYAASRDNENCPRASNAAGPDPFPAPPPPASPTALCSFCNGPCVGESHESYYTLHPEAAQVREDERLNREFRMRFGLPVESDEPARPQPTDEQRQQAELRKTLGWAGGVMNEQRGYRRRE